MLRVRMLRSALPAALALMALLPVTARASSTLVVSADRVLCPNAGYTDLTAAVQAAQSHDTIKICPGTYVVGPATPTAVPPAGLPGLVIDKTLTIIGAGASKVTIEPSQALASTSSSDNVRDKLGNVITVQNTAPGSTSDQDVNPTISGVTISDGGMRVDAGIAFNNAAGSITDSTIGPFTGSPSPSAGWGVVASNNEAVTPYGAFVRDVTVSGNLIKGYGAGGVLIDGSESTQPIYFRSGIATTGTITNNVITGAGDPTVPSQVGIQLNAGARGTITGNQVTGNLGATSGSATSPGSGVGILLTDADVTTTVPGSTTSFYTSIGANNLFGNGYGIFNGTADFPDGPSPGAPCPCSVYVNGSGFTPTSTQLPASLTNTAMSNSSATVTVNYDVPGAPVHAATPRGSWYGLAAGPTVGGPSAGGADGVSEATTSSSDADSVIFKPFATTAFAAPPGPTPVTDAPPSIAWGTPAAGDHLVAGQADELLAVATDDFGVTSVDITANGTDLGPIALVPYETSWTPPTSLIGHTVTLTATATDEAGQVTTATEQVPVLAAPEPGHGGGSGTPGPKATSLTIALPAGFASKPMASIDLTPSFTAAAGVAGAQYLLDGRTICKTAVSPFRCVYRPTGADPGTRRLTIIATDTTGATSQITVEVRILRFSVRSITARGTRRGSTVTVTGRLRTPARVTDAEGCGRGRVQVTATRAGHRTIHASTVIGKRCGFEVKLSGIAGPAHLVVHFLGNPVLKPATVRAASA